jgi:hypothetical protein
MKKVCSTCSVEKPTNLFYKHIRSKDGLTSSCKKCTDNRVKAYTVKNKDLIRERKKKYRSANKERAAAYQKTYYLENKNQLKQKMSQYAKDNLADFRVRASKWKKNNNQKVNAAAAKRRSMKKRQLPAWVSEFELKQISEFYKNCPKGYHVDHVIPLKGKIVSGLHCLANLQYLPAAINLSKGNQWPYDYR